MKSTGNPTLHFPHSKLVDGEVSASGPSTSSVCSQRRELTEKWSQGKGQAAGRGQTLHTLHINKVNQLTLSTCNFLARLLHNPKAPRTQGTTHLGQ